MSPALSELRYLRLKQRAWEASDFDCCDREIITAIAQVQGLGENCMEHTLGNHAWQHIPPL